MQMRMARRSVELVDRGDSRLDELRLILKRFVDDRSWAQFHDAKNLAMAVAGEAGELLAELQWLTPEEARSLTPDVKQRVAEEAADVLIYLLHLEHVLDVDLVDEARAKALRNAHRFPPGGEGHT
jgi:NTP pyrophosphatase (non-canonical NTP hydrolase)